MKEKGLRFAYNMINSNRKLKIFIETLFKLINEFKHTW